MFCLDWNYDTIYAMSDKMDSGQFLTVTEFFDLKIEPLRQEIHMMRKAIEKLSVGMVTQSEYQQIQSECADQGQQLVALDDRLDKLEHYHNVGMWAFRTLVGIATAVSIAALIRLLMG